MKSVLEGYLGEILTSCEKLRYTICYGEEFLQPEDRRVPLLMCYKKAEVQYYPLGVIGVIIPWSIYCHSLLLTRG
jgi:acyl-CoA reductase-like NAD-dependent aldehyde dehydrogenase